MQGDVGATEQVFSAQRRAMVDGQIRTFDVTDARVIRAFDLTPRELYMPEEYHSLCYSDAMLTLKSRDSGRPVRTLMQPMHLARLLQSVDPAPDAHVLVVAGGMGYAAALLCEMVASVVSLESDASLSAVASAALAKTFPGRAKAVTGPLPQGYPTDAPYDAIIVLGGVETSLDALVAQLKPGGTLGAVEIFASPAGRRYGRVMLYRGFGRDVSKQAVFDANMPVLDEFKAGTGFVF
jgi:protein-L-isoaspartate(D-aspartate) O-methyltransferase